MPTTKEKLIKADNFNPLVRAQKVDVEFSRSFFFVGAGELHYEGHKDTNIC